MSFDIKGFKNPHLKDFSEYKTMYEQSVKNPSKFFHEQALKEIDWFNEPKMGFSGEFTKPIWFEDGILNILDIVQLANIILYGTLEIYK